MNSLAPVIGLAGNTLLVVYVALFLGRAQVAPLAVRLGIAVTVGVLLWLPAAGVQAILYVRGTLGDLSITTLVLLVAGCWHLLAGRKPRYDKEVRLLLLGVLVMGLTLYPWSLGLTRVDPYSWGYGSYVLLSVLLLLTLLCWLREANRVVGVVLLAMTAYLLELGESTNLWDYLVDPLIVLFAAVWLGKELSAHAWRRLSHPEA